MQSCHQYSSIASRLPLPPGFHFQPSEEELVGYFLLCQIRNLNCHSIELPLVDIKGKSPSDIAAVLSEQGSKDFYFFSPVPTSRGVSKGAWKVKNVGNITKENGGPSRLPAVKTLLAYSEDGKKSTKWVMTEYRFADKNPLNFPNDLAVYHLTNSPKKSRSSRAPRSSAKPSPVAKAIPALLFSYGADSFTESADSDDLSAGQSAETGFNHINSADLEMSESRVGSPSDESEESDDADNLMI